MSEKDIKVYAHVGLGKVASTYLQKKVFPKFKNINYIHSSLYNYYPKIVNKGEHNSYLISREFDRQFDREVRKLYDNFPEVNVIVILREPSGWVASQYRRYVKNGGRKSILEFIGLEGDAELWDKTEALFMPKLNLIFELFKNKPLILFHDELKKDNKAFISRIADYCNAEVDFFEISLKPYHKSYSEKQLIVMKSLASFFKLSDPVLKKNPKSKALIWLRNKSRLHFCHLLLYFAYFVPKALVKGKTLYTSDELDIIKEYYRSDWSECLNYKG